MNAEDLKVKEKELEQLLYEISAKNKQAEQLLSRISAKEKRVRNRSIFFTVLLVIAGALSIGVSLHEVRDLRRESSDLNRQVEQDREVLSVINPVLEKYGALPKMLTGENVNPNLLEQSLQANNEMEAIALREISPKRKHATVVYYQKDVDGNKVARVLNDFGFTVRTGNPLSQQQTNTIVYGSRVTPEDAKLAAYILIRGGFNIKGIYRTNLPTPTEGLDRRTAIQILAYATIDKRPALTVESIHDATTFPLFSLQ
jgi:hypothetical protein